MSIGNYTPFGNGPIPLDKISLGNTRAYFLALFTDGTYNSSLGTTWVELQSIAQRRGISFYPDVTESDVAVTWPAKGSILVHRLADILGIPFWLKN